MLTVKKNKIAWFVIGVVVAVLIITWKQGYFLEGHTSLQSSNKINTLDNINKRPIKNNISNNSIRALSNPPIEQYMEKLNKQLAALQSQINQLKNEQGIYSTGLALSELTPEEEVEIATQAMQQEVDFIDNTLDSETVDHAWAQDAHVALTEALQNNEHMVGVQLDLVECKSTLCRLSLSFDDQSSLNKGLRTMSSVTPWEGQAFFRVDDMESGEAVVYLAREGHELPNTID